MGEELLCVATAARELTDRLGRQVSPRNISLLFYYGELSDDKAPIVGGRRVIHRDLLPAIGNALRRKRWLGRAVDRREAST